MVGVLRHTMQSKWVTISRFMDVYSEQYNMQLNREDVLQVAKANRRFMVWEPDGEEPQICGRPRDHHHYDGQEACVICLISHGVRQALVLHACSE